MLENIFVRLLISFLAFIPFGSILFNSYSVLVRKIISFLVLVLVQKNNTALYRVGAAVWDLMSHAQPVPREADRLLPRHVFVAVKQSTM